VLRGLLLPWLLEVVGVGFVLLLLVYKGDTRVPADNGDLSLKDEDVRDNETYIKDNDSKFGGN
jgi:hypothetical protein